MVPRWQRPQQNEGAAAVTLPALSSAPATGVLHVTRTGSGPTPGLPALSRHGLPAALSPRGGPWLDRGWRVLTCPPSLVRFVQLYLFYFNDKTPI